MFDVEHREIIKQNKSNILIKIIKINPTKKNRISLDLVSYATCTSTIASIRNILHSSVGVFCLIVWFPLAVSFSIRFIVSCH